ncbi:hypothetical protein JCM5353_008328 [Sporobolomyces roseus]
MISNVLCLSLLVGAAMANPLPSTERHNSRSVGNKETPPSTPKSATFGRNNAPIRRSSGLDAIGSPDSINNVLSIPILSNVAGDNSNSNSLLDLGNLRERGLLDDLDLNLLGYQSETDQTTTNVAGNNNDVLTIAQKRALLDLGDVNVLGNQQESTTTTTNVQGNGNNVNVNSLNNNRDSNIDNSNRSNNGGSPSRSNKVYYDDDDEYVCSGSNRGRSGGQRNVKSHPTHTQRAVKQRKQASRNKAAKQATSTWKPTQRPTNNYVAPCPAQQTTTVTKWATKWNQAAASTVTKWSQGATVTKWDTKTVTRNLAVATPSPTRSHLLDLDLDAKVADIVDAATDLKILRE